MPPLPPLELCSDLPPAQTAGAGDDREKPKMPGTKAKQAEALFQNVAWLCREFGLEHIAFLTLTVGDFKSDLAGEHFEKISDRKEAERRFNSLLTHVIRSRYRAGVIVREPHKDGAVHYHLICTTAGDIRSGVNMDACFPTRENGRPVRPPNYTSATPALREEWKFWRDKAPAYGFGRCNMQPVKKCGRAVARYAAKYICKTWMRRRPEDKGARLVRYFGTWRKNPACDELTKAGTPKAVAPPCTAIFGWCSPWPRAWRETCKQVQTITTFLGDPITPENVKAKCGRRWAWRFTKLFRSLTLLPLDELPEAVRKVMEAHNAEVEKTWTEPDGRQNWRNIVQTTPADWRKDTFDPDPGIEQLLARRENFHRCRDFDDVLHNFPQYDPINAEN